MMRWIRSEGGPLLLLPTTSLADWSGCFGCGTACPVDEESPARGSANTDYDRACEVMGHLGVIDVSGNQGLILNDEPLETIWLPSSGNFGGVFVRWIFAEQEDVLADLANDAADLEYQLNVSLQIQSPELTLFDAALAGYKVLGSVTSDFVPVRLEPTLYMISTALYNPNSFTSLLVHRVTPTERAK